MDRKQKLNANIWKYYLIRIMAKRIVWPILTFFLLRNELSPAQIGVIFATGSIVGLLLEVPSGALADKFGRRNALILANLGWALSMLIFAVGDSFTAYLIANAAYWAFGTLCSGTHEALIYETLHELGRKDDIKRITGRSLFISHRSASCLKPNGTGKNREYSGKRNWQKCVCNKNNFDQQIFTCKRSVFCRSERHQIIGCRLQTALSRSSP